MRFSADGGASSLRRSPRVGSASLLAWPRETSPSFAATRHHALVSALE